MKMIGFLKRTEKIKGRVLLKRVWERLGWVMGMVGKIEEGVEIWVGFAV